MVVKLVQHSNILITLDNPALVFKTLADVIKREASPNSDEEGIYFNYV